MRVGILWDLTDLDSVYLSYPLAVLGRYLVLWKIVMGDMQDYYSTSEQATCEDIKENQISTKTDCRHLTSAQVTTHVFIFSLLMLIFFFMLSIHRNHCFIIMNRLICQEMNEVLSAKKKSRNHLSLPASWMRGREAEVNVVLTIRIDFNAYIIYA